jgi:small subunit ribosomal protein S17
MSAPTVGNAVLGGLTPTVKLIQSIIPPKRARPIVGWVVSSGLMQKTVKVRVPRIVIVPKYRKYVTRHTMLLVHDENGECDVGDKVELAKSRPYSKMKHHIVSKILIKDPGTAFLRENPQYAKTRLELKAMRVQRQLVEDEYKVTERLKRQQARTKLAEDASHVGDDTPTSKYDPKKAE